MSDYDNEIVEIVADVLHEADDDRIPDDTIWYGTGCTVADEISARVRSEVLNEKNEVTDSDGNESAGYVGVRPRVLETVGYRFEVYAKTKNDSIRLVQIEQPVDIYKLKGGLDYDVVPDSIEELVKRSEVADWLEAFKDTAVEELESTSGLEKADQRHLQSKISVLDELIEFFESDPE